MELALLADLPELLLHYRPLPFWPEPGAQGLIVAV
jgi:hypothetical protein